LHRAGLDDRTGKTGLVDDVVGQRPALALAREAFAEALGGPAGDVQESRHHQLTGILRRRK